MFFKAGEVCKIKSKYYYLVDEYGLKTDQVLNKNEIFMILDYMEEISSFRSPISKYDYDNFVIFSHYKILIYNKIKYIFVSKSSKKWIKKLV